MAAHRLAALWEPMSLGRPCDSAEAVRSFTKRGSAIDARLHTCVRSTPHLSDCNCCCVHSAAGCTVAERVLSACGAGCWWEQAVGRLGGAELLL